jgi:hypothetical protein
MMSPMAAFSATLTVAAGDTKTIAGDEAYDSVTIAGTLELTGAKLTSSGAVKLTGGKVIINAGATLTAVGVTAASSASTIEFNGGRLVTSGQINAGDVSLSLVGNSGDVLVDFNCSQWIYAFTASSGGKTTVSGNHKLVLSVKSSSIGLVNKTSYLALSHTGRTEIRNGTLSAYYDKFPNSGELFIAGGATLDIGGAWFTFGSLTGAGNVTGTGQITIDVPSAATGCCYPNIASTITLIKNGPGILKTIGTMPSSFTVNGGEVRAAPRSELGYSQFKFKVDGVGTPAMTGMQLNELAFFAGVEDVTAGYIATAFDNNVGYNGGKIFDKSDSGKWWYNYDNASNPSFDNAWVTVSYPERRIVTGYRLKSSDWGGDVPKSWRLYGRDAGGEWELIDQRTDDAGAPEPENNWSEEYAGSCAANPGATVFSNLILEKGTTLSAPMGTSLSCSSLTDRGAAYSFAAGSSVDIGVTEACELKGIVGSGAFAKSGAADLVAYGSASPESVRVRSGVLAFHTPVALREWKLAIGDVYDASGDELTLGEFAVYDQEGNRLNVTGTVTMASKSSSFSSAQAAYLYDGIDNRQAWVKWSDLNVNIADETTWPWTSFTLADGAGAVAGYNLRTATYESKGSPKTWRLYARASSSDEWILIDSKINADTPSASYTWYDGEWAWPGKIAWLVSSAVADTAAAFPAATLLTVDPNAMLDLTHANGTALSDIRIDGDAVGCGTISGGALAATGTIRVSVVDGLTAGNSALPLRLVGCAGTGNIKNWTLIVNGVVDGRKSLSIAADGTVTVLNPGLKVILR